MNRRSFMAVTGTTVAATIVNPSWAIDEFGPKRTLDYIGVQLYTLREDMVANPVATLRKVSQIGFNHIESYGYDRGKLFGIGAKQYKALIDDIGLKQHSGHVATGYGEPSDSTNMVNNWERVLEDAALMGQEYVVLGWIGDAYRKTIDDYKRLIDLMNVCAAKAKEYKLQFCFHNHDVEFIKIDGQVPYELMLKDTDKDLVKFELDHYWTERANVKSDKLIKANPGRFPLFHIKDMKKKNTEFTEVGEGRIKYPKILALSEIGGTNYFYVEQDNTYNIKPLESIERSYLNLRAMKY
jgi:sugar phosphate isomerase/epimerase